MEHPLVEVDPALNAEQLLNKINELTRKMGFAHRSGNGHLVTQIQMAIEAYRNRYQEKIEEMYRAQTKSSNNHADKINIS